MKTFSKRERWNGDLDNEDEIEDEIEDENESEIEKSNKANCVIRSQKRQRQRKCEDEGLSDGKSPLHFAAGGGESSYPHLISLLSSLCPGINSEGDKYLRTPLHFAVASKYEPSVLALIEKKPSWVHYQDMNGNTPLHLAVINGSPSLVKLLLLSARASPSTPDFYGRSPLLWARSRIRLFKASFHPHLSTSTSSSISSSSTTTSLNNNNNDNDDNNNNVDKQQRINMH